VIDINRIHNKTLYYRYMTVKKRFDCYHHWTGKAGGGGGGEAEARRQDFSKELLRDEKPLLNSNDHSFLHPSNTPFPRSQHDTGTAGISYL
jgi:hypothetical protein